MTDRKLKDVSQRNPAAPEHSVGDVFRRGPAVAADGGERGVAKTPAEEAESVEDGADDETPPTDEQTMKHVDQTPPDEDASANSVWERGGEPTPEDDESVDDE
jgi:hypothetical protein